MEKNLNTPDSLAELMVQSGVKKANTPFLKVILLGIMAGAFIALGAESSNLAVHGISNVGIARTIAGLMFPTGLILIILVGGELFTGNCLIAGAVIDHKVPCYRLITNLILVYFSNMIGSICIAALVYGSGQFDYSQGGLGAYTIKVAVGKVGIDANQAILSGVLCNILVCFAIIAAFSAKDVIGKIFAAFFPIWVFVISGFEHCVANMYYIPAGMMAAQNPKYVEAAQSLYGLTEEQISNLSISGMIHNLLPVTIGNIIGGAICVAGFYYCIYMIRWGKKKEEK
ncbi:MAG: formate/nitrite transporter family protein [Lachnospiraceae bacterium]|nr:formate/nitrite transporter family protein [Lachnospiraceae bacterium]